ncbi:hypothetical protein Nepgr_027392 [Nepenthes gracilis]|uniref:Phytocyanin domain-containing protein n=1 Tax=Nepenthes gracilis TaxID=150966 RepID=A0AAD3TAQ7_NEPGR|nr:hypothetical protein Nepgr_027392 [Nepenthes gracilis]
MAFQRILWFFFIISAACFSSSHARRFYVGNRDGWVLDPSESYSQWAGRNRFLVNDTLYFKYKKKEDSVLEVSKDDYDHCNTENPIAKFEDGDSEFTLQRSGPFYFISGNKDHCQKGQKLIVVVISERHFRPAPATLPPSSSPPAAAPPKATTPSSPSPAEGAPKGSSSPASSPQQQISPAITLLLFSYLSL